MASSQRKAGRFSLSLLSPTPPSPLSLFLQRRERRQRFFDRFPPSNHHRLSSEHPIHHNNLFFSSGKSSLLLHVISPLVGQDVEIVGRQLQTPPPPPPPPSLSLLLLPSGSSCSLQRIMGRLQSQHQHRLVRRVLSCTGLGGCLKGREARGRGGRRAFGWEEMERTASFSFFSWA